MLAPVSRVALPLLALASALSACAPTNETARVAQGIAGGVNDTTHSNVVGIAIIQSTGLATCSGSLITPTLVLTARHCVSHVEEGGVVCAPVTINGVPRTATLTEGTFSGLAFNVTTEQTINFRSGRFTRVVEVLIPPDSMGTPLCGRDIALLRLAQPITTVAPIRPRLDIIARNNEVFTASGFGVTSDNAMNSGQRRMREGLTVEHVGRIAARGGGVVMEERELLANEGTCRGDSGGPALDELGEVFGVLSRGGAGCTSPIYTRVDAFSDWIRAQAAAAATAGNYPAPDWVTPPEERPGAIGDSCSGDNQCELPLACESTGWARECTSNDCAQCPEGWLCDPAAPRCMRDPATRPEPPPPDAGTPKPPPDAGAPVVADSGAPTTMTPLVATEPGGCDVTATHGGARHGAFALAMMAMMAFTRARRRR